MEYKIEFKPKALKDCKNLPKKDVVKIFAKIEGLKNNLDGDVKRLTNYSPEYMLRIGDYRVLFEIENGIIVIYRIGHRKNIY